METTYIPIVMPLLAKSTRNRYEGIIENYLKPAFGKLCLRDLTALSVQSYFSQMATSPLAHESRDKIRDVLSRPRVGGEVRALNLQPGRECPHASGAPRPENLKTVSLQRTI